MVLDSLRTMQRRSLANAMLSISLGPPRPDAAARIGPLPDDVRHGLRACGVDDPSGRVQEPAPRSGLGGRRPRYGVPHPARGARGHDPAHPRHSGPRTTERAWRCKADLTSCHDTVRWRCQARFTSEPAMSNEERGQWVYLVVIVVTYGAYLVIVLGQLGGGAPADVDYVPVMLGAIGIAIVLAIVGRIVVGIAGGIAAEMAGHERRPRGGRPRPRHRALRRVRRRHGPRRRHGRAVRPDAGRGPTTSGSRTRCTWRSSLSAVVGTAVKLVAYRRGI